MPLRAITVLLNHDQSKKFVFLPSGQNHQNFKEAILRDARNKFRSKTLCTVYLRGGAILGEQEEITESTMQVWVGREEPYAGPPVDTTRSQGPGGHGIHIIKDKSYIDDVAMKQLEVVSRLNGVRLAVGMPDLHPGNRFPIGCAIAAEGVYPALIGSDVGCGIALYRLPGAAARYIARPTKLANFLRGLDDPWSGDVKEWLAKYGIDRASSFDAASLGTVGAGNHFAEICTLEKIVDVAASQPLRLEEDALYLLVHTGSRGLGASILENQTKDLSNPYITPDSPELAAYLTEHDYAVKWAIANRDLVAHRIKECIYPSGADEDFELEKLVDVTHNSVTQHFLTVSDARQSLWIHRKGAAPADQGIVPCPGSRGDYTWLLQPSGDGQFNAHSLAHGAGRRYGRHAMHEGTKIARGALTTTALGSEVICTDGDLLVEERPEAYKDVACVVEDMEGRNICKGIAVLRPVVTYKIREAGEGRR